MSRDVSRIKENNRLVKQIINIKRRHSRFGDMLEETRFGQNSYKVSMHKIPFN
jgi:hypothetical protein